MAIPSWMTACSAAHVVERDRAPDPVRLLGGEDLLRDEDGEDVDGRWVGAGGGLRRQVAGPPPRRRRAHGSIIDALAFAAITSGRARGRSPSSAFRWTSARAAGAWTWARRRCGARRSTARVRELGYEVDDRGDIEVSIPETRDPGDPKLKYLKEIRKTCEALAGLGGRTSSARAGCRSSSAATIRSPWARSRARRSSTARSTRRRSASSGSTPTAT